MRIIHAMRTTKRAAPISYHLYVKEAPDGLLRWFDKKTNKQGSVVSWHWLQTVSWFPYTEESKEIK